jgi:ribosomal protein L37AE/L43A
MKANSATIWLCYGCIAALVNSEWPDEPTNPEPLSLITDDDEITAGALCDRDHEVPGEEHSDECERIAFSSHQCEGCGTYDAGERHAATIWYD